MSDHVFCVRASWREVGGAVTWSATCERCGAELDVDAGTAVTLVRAVNIPREQFAAFAEEVQRRWEEASRTGRPIVAMAEHVDVQQQLAPTTLDRALADHARACPSAK